MKRSSKSMQNMTPAKAFFFTRIFPAIFILVGGITVYLGISDMLLAKASNGWPNTQGAISASEMEYHRDSDGGGTYHARILYDYEVFGVLYSNDRIAYGDYGSSNPSHARSIVNRYSKQLPVTVYYQPEHPQESVLETGIKGQAYFLPLFGLVFLSAGLLMAYYLPKNIRSNIQEKPESEL